jgi:hypothetical protein
MLAHGSQCAHGSPADSGPMTAELPTSRYGRAAAVLGRLLVCLLLGAAVWGAWLGWDHTYYYDAATHTNQGPYRPAQVVACAATVALLTVLLALRWHPMLVAAGITVGFWTVWTVQASGDDSSGLYVVGSALLLVGLVIGTGVAGAVGYALRPLVHRLARGRARTPAQ